MQDLGGKTINVPAPGVLQLSNGTVNGNVTVRSGSVLRNLIILGDILVDADLDGLEVTHCAARSFGYAGQAFYLVQNARLVANVFEPTDAGPFTAIFVGNPGNGLVITDNLLRNAREGVHVMDGAAGIVGLVISYNEVVGMRRHGIEVQVHGTGAVCEANYLHGWRKNLGDQGKDPPGDGRICISWACGPTKPGGSIGPGSVNSSKCGVLRNVLVGDGECQWPMVADAWKNAGIEWMGDDGVVDGNHFRNGGGNMYTFCRRWRSQNNVFIGTKQKSWDDETSASDAKYNWHDAPTVTNDRYFALNDPAAPPQPAAGPRVTPGPSSTALPTNGAPPITPSDQKPPMKFKATVRSPGIVDLSFDAVPAGWSIWRKSTRGADVPAKVFDLATGGVGTADVGPDATSGSPALAPNWEYSYSLRDTTGAEVANAHVQMPPDPLPAPVVTPTPTPAPPMDLTALSAAVGQAAAAAQQATAAVAAVQAELAKLKGN